MPPLHVAICLPSVGTHESETALSLAAMTIINRSQGLNQSLLGQQQAGIADSRNTLVRNALEIGADWLFWIDSDMAFDPSGMLRLLGHGKDIVGATYPRRVPPYIINGRPVKGDIFEEELQDMEFMPFGFMLVKADVYRNISEPWFTEAYPQIGTPAEQIVSVLEKFGDLAPNELIGVPAELDPSVLAGPAVDAATELFGLDDEFKILMPVREFGGDKNSVWSWEDPLDPEFA